MSQRLISALKRRAVYWAGQLTSLAKGYAPNHLKAHIRSRVEEKDGKFIIRTFVNRFANPKEKYGTLDARAQEYGSGLRARRGSKGTYKIIGKPFLVFPWDMVTVGVHRTKEGKAVLHEVNHPGIPPYKGQGYIAPAMKDLRKRARAELSKDIRQAILGDLRQSFGRK